VLRELLRGVEQLGVGEETPTVKAAAVPLFVVEIRGEHRGRFVIHCKTAKN